MKKELSIKHRKLLFFLGCKKLWTVSKTYFIIILFFSIASGIISPFNAIVWQNVLDTVTIMLETKVVKKSIILFLMSFSILNLASFVLSEFLRYLKQTYSDMVGISISTEILKKSASFPMEAYDNPTLYDSLKIALDESAPACFSLIDVISDTTKSIIQLVSFIIIVLQLNWIIAPICFASAIPLLYMNLKTDAFWYSIFEQRTETSRLIDYLKVLITKNENIKEAKLYKLNNKIINYIQKTFSAFLDSDIKARKKCFLGLSSVVSLDELASFITKIVIVFFSIKTGCTIGTIALYFSSQENLKSSIITLFSQITVSQKCLLYLQSLEKIENMDISQPPTEKITFNKNFKYIEFQNVSFHYPNNGNDVIKNISIRFENGKTYSIVGLNGAGKTSLIKLLLRIYKPTSGQILMDGVDINNIDIEEYYAHISAVFQDFLKLPYSIYENIALKQVPSEKTRFDEVIKFVGIEDLISNLPNQEKTLLMKEWTGGVDISHGQWQKIAIARCCYGDSAIAILDEPFSSLDAKAETQIIDRISSHRKGKLTVYITHQFTSISLADQICVLKDGQLTEFGTHEELVQNGELYYELYNAQLEKLKKSNY